MLVSADRAFIKRVTLLNKLPQKRENYSGSPYKFCLALLLVAVRGFSDRLLLAAAATTTLTTLLSASTPAAVARFIARTRHVDSFSRALPLRVVAGGLRGRRTGLLSATAATLALFLATAVVALLVRGALLLRSVLGLLPTWWSRRLLRLIAVALSIVILRLGGCLVLVKVLSVLGAELLLLVLLLARYINFILCMNSLLYEGACDGVATDLLPLVVNLLVLDLGEAALDRHDQVFFFLPMGQLEGLLDDEVAIVVTDEGVEAFGAGDLRDKNGSSVCVTVLHTLFDHAR
mmetsp:Transcript_7378/g.10460  ORF Transcript_7378/g.10460 Transcript_7378/m.10460 type:complete len:290 (+) Transcript_7378:518-1387(+)